MGQYLTEEEVRVKFVEPLTELLVDLQGLCRKWKEAVASEKLARPDLLLNNVMPEQALGVLRKFHRESSGKLEDAIAGVYRYRDTERRQKQTKAKTAKSRKRGR